MVPAIQAFLVIAAIVFGSGYDHELEKWHNYLMNSGYVGKGNVKIYFTDQHVFFEKYEVEGWPVVSIQQLIVDLIREGAECKEAAEILMKRIYNA
jgi:hypothetical protein